MQFQNETKSGALARAVDWMKRLHLGREEALAAAYPHTLSGGMRQRALIAMGTAGGAKTLLADEPTKGLDAPRAGQITGLFRQLQDRTLLCVSHDLRFARELADRISVTYAAQQVECCGRDAFFQRPLHPYSQLMLAALPENGLNASIGFAPPHQEYAGMGCHFYKRCPYASQRCRMPPPMVEREDRRVRCWRYAD